MWSINTTRSLACLKCLIVDFAETPLSFRTEGAPGGCPVVPGPDGCAKGGRQDALSCCQAITD